MMQDVGRKLADYATFRSKMEFSGELTLHYALCCFISSTNDLSFYMGVLCFKNWLFLEPSVL